MPKKQIFVTKENGGREMFDPGKLIHSLQRAGAKDRAIDEVVAEVKRELRSGMSTSEIYRLAFTLLRKIEKPTASRYSLKRAVLELGPSGFPFEKFVGEIFKSQGFEVQTDLTMQGACVEHEIDVFAWNKEKMIIVEAKFHNELAVKSDLKVALYVEARMEDIEKNRAARGERKIDECWLVTNTKFTKAAIQYANCRGNLRVISWTYPRYGNLHDLIDRAKIHPITALTTLTRQDKLTLMTAGVVLCKTMEENRGALTKLGFTGAKLEKVLEEGRNLCSSSVGF